MLFSCPLNPFSRSMRSLRLLVLDENKLDAERLHVLSKVTKLVSDGVRIRTWAGGSQTLLSHIMLF